MPLTLTDAVDLAVVERNGFVESRHAGIAVVLSPDGSVVEAIGSVDEPILPRSSLKPLQAVACLAAGAPLDGVHLGLATASHSGTDAHVAAVRDILDGAGLTETALGCPAAWPGDTTARDAMVRAHAEPAAIRMNCSGKHAAMLLTCAVNGWDPTGYLDPAHPLQAQVREILERLTGEKPVATVIDGCGAPMYAMSLAGLARGIHRVGTSSERSPFALHRGAGALVRSVRENPWTIDGPGRPDTIVIEKTGTFAKTGAEGIMVMVAPDGTTVAVKILDGSARPAAAVALRLLERHDALDPALVAETMAALPLAISGGGRTVGAVRPSF